MRVRACSSLPGRQAEREAGLGNLTRRDIATRVAREAHITEAQARLAVETMIEALVASLAKGERIELRGFGTFRVAPRKGGLGRNIKTGEVMRLRPGRRVRFHPGKHLDDIGGGTSPAR